jgi:hypothetical protein
MLIYHMRDKQHAHWWLQLRDVVSPHRHITMMMMTMMIIVISIIIIIMDI